LLQFFLNRYRIVVSIVAALRRNALHSPVICDRGKSPHRKLLYFASPDYSPLTVKYKIASSGPLAGELRRIAAGEIRRARNALLRDQPHAVATEKVHKARQHLKKVRGLLRLAQTGFGKKEFKRLNILFRDIGRDIRAARDAVALIEALDGLTLLIRQSFDGKPPPIIIRLRRLLVRDARKLARASISSGAPAQTAQHLKGALQEVKTWNLEHLTEKSARRAWRRARALCRSAFHAASSAPSDENLHEWRKQATTLWHETVLLRKRCPDLQKKRHEVKRLIDLLGDDHDLAILAIAASERKAVLGNPDQLKILLALLAARRKKLREDAFALALHCF
jgi:hypothetical protein